MPQERNAAPGWFVKVIDEGTKGLNNVTAYLDDVIVFNENPNSYVLFIREFFQQLWKHNLKLLPAKSQLGAIEENFVCHSISPSGISPNALKFAALAEMPKPKDIKQLRSLWGGLSYYRKFLPSQFSS